MAGQLSFSGVARALNQRDYAIYTYSNTAAMVGEWMQRVGIGWLTWELTGSTAWLGIVACADMVPGMLVSPLAGAYADRSDRLRFTQRAMMLTALQPAALSALFFLDLLSIWLLVVLAMYSGIMSGFNQAARLAIIPNLVDRAELSPAVALSSVTYNISRFLGPAVAGNVIALAGVGYVFLANLTFFILFIAALFTIALKYESKPASHDQHILAHTIDGLRYTMRHPGIGPVMFLVIIGSLGQRPFIELLPGFADRVFNRGPEALGWMVSMVGLGALCGASYLASRVSTRGLTKVAVHAVLACAFTLTLFALAGDFWLAMICLFFTGSVISIAATGVMTLVMSAAEDTMRGRVISLYGLVFRGGPAIGALLMGMAAEHVGLRIPVIVGAAFCLLPWFVVTRRLRRIAPELEAEKPHER
jgi:predicted MFS family arabinose efflux permease